MEKINDCKKCKYLGFYKGKLCCEKAHVILLEFKACKNFVLKTDKKETTSVSWYEKRFNKVL